MLLSTAKKCESFCVVGMFWLSKPMPQKHKNIFDTIGKDETPNAKKEWCCQYDTDGTGLCIDEESPDRN